MTSKIISERMTFQIPGETEKVLERIWTIGGDSGWYYGTDLWKFRGWLDKITGGIGFRKGRRDSVELIEGDQIDFWRVETADKENRFLKLKAEMSLPGIVFLQWVIRQNELIQTIDFIPNGWKGKAYWILVRPFHFWIFYNMGRRLVQ
ncbi:DUF2867 domain-containing protein [Aquiflexum sp.]|uniref:DUF2867 domain-containing protein n=1 Tax=Aquiflexum sp. TaxID=1872584 RepID=UPI003593D879